MDGETLDLKKGASVVELWIGVLVGPIAALTQLEANYALVLWACRANQFWPLHLVSLLALLFTLLAGLLAFRIWNQVDPKVEGDGEGTLPRSKFMAAVGMLISGLMLLVVIAQWLAVFVYHPCAR